ncbi:MAG: DUF4390 domain-containing protein [Candidatus Wenzhouxiangella sp. M2_3B_020]
MPLPPIPAGRFFRAVSIGTVFTIFVCAGCTDQGAGGQSTAGRLEIDPNMIWRGESLDIDAGVSFDPTAIMREALESGVDLQIEIVTRVSKRIGPVALIEEERRHPITMRFLPLTEQWQLEIDAVQTNFPRLWLLLDALQQTRTYATGLTRERVGGDDWQVQARARFNREALPSPMHLPSLVSPDWRLAGAWHTWQLDAS